MKDMVTRECNHQVLNSSSEALFLALSATINLSLQQKMTFIKVFTHNKFPKDDCILHIGEMFDKLYFIHHGILRLYYLTEDGREFNKGFFYRNQFLYPIAPVAKKYPSRFAIKALTDTECLFCSYDVFKEILKKFGLWDRFAKFHAELLADQKVEREADFLLCSAKERYLKFMKRFSDIADRIPDYHIASFLGISNVTLSRIKKSCSHF